jgi:hypothetical protein
VYKAKRIVFSLTLVVLASLACNLGQRATPTPPPTEPLAVATATRDAPTATHTPTQEAATATPTVEQPAGSIDCQTDLDCFIEASASCRPATVTYTVTVDVFGLLMTSRSLLEIKGLEADKCVFYMKTEQVDIEFSEELIQQMLAGGATQEQIEEQEKAANEQADMTTEGADGACRFDAADLAAMLSRWQEGAFSSEDWAVAECGGAMFGQ